MFDDYQGGVGGGGTNVPTGDTSTPPPTTPPAEETPVTPAEGPAPESTPTTPEPGTGGEQPSGGTPTV